MLQGLRKTYAEFHRVEIADDVLRAAIQYADRYLHDRFLPDKAIDLLDEACSRARIRWNRSRRMNASAAVTERTSPLWSLSEPASPRKKSQKRSGKSCSRSPTH
ncbi:MAG: hypothetical protein ACLT2C_00825 [Ruminococcus sp.]